MKKSKLLQYLESLVVYRRVRQWMQTHSLPGFGDIPIYNVLTFLRNELRKENIIIRANAMAYSFLIALFPSIIFLFTLLPYLPIQGFVLTMKQSVLQVLPEQSSLYIVQVIDQLTSIPRGGLLSVGLFLALFFASNGMISMLRGFEKSYHISYKRRSGLRRRLVAIQLTVIIGILFVSSIAFIVLGRSVLEALLSLAHIDIQSFTLLVYFRWIPIFMLFYAGISIVYRYGPAMHRRIRFFSPGATLATILSLLTSLGFSYYVNRFDTYNQIYGSLGALIALMLWMQLNSMIILLGYELNASIKINKAIRHQNAISDGA